MKKQERQRYIKRLLSSKEIERQEDFVSLLHAENIEVTQATISRDIKDMQLVKVPSATGGYHYSLPVQKKMDTEKKLKRTLKDAYVSYATQDKFVLIKVLPGNGPALASLVEAMHYEHVFGTLGDDSTVLIICKSLDATLELQQTLQRLLSDN